MTDLATTERVIDGEVWTRVRNKDDLTTREEHCLRQFALGFTFKEIAGKIATSEHSVQTYKSRACTKLSLFSRAQVVQYGMRQGWFK